MDDRRSSSKGGRRSILYTNVRVHETVSRWQLHKDMQLLKRRSRLLPAILRCSFKHTHHTVHPFSWHGISNQRSMRWTFSCCAKANPDSALPSNAAATNGLGNVASGSTREDDDGARVDSSMSALTSLRSVDAPLP